MLDSLDWKSLPQNAANQLASSVLSQGNSTLPPETSVEGRIADLPFYKNFHLAWIVVRPSGQKAGVDMLFLTSGEHTHLLDGTSSPIHAVNESDPVEVTAETAADYLRFFCMFVYGDEGPFQIVEQLAAPPEAESEAAQEGAAIARHVQPLATAEQDSDGKYRFTATVCYGEWLFRALFAVGKDGDVVMLEDEALVEGVSRAVLPSIPAVHSMEVYQKNLQPGQVVTAAGSSVLETLVIMLLEQALEKQVRHRLIVHFNRKVENYSPIEKFVKLVATTAPVIAIESSIPFVEEIVAGIINAQRKDREKLAIIRGEADGDDTRLRISLPRSRPAIVLIPLHAYRSIVDVMRVTHQLAVEKVSVLIGCDRFEDLPPTLRDITDLTLQLPSLAPATFENLFLRIFGMAVPSDWRQEGTHWVKHILHTDFEHPLGFRLTADEALKFIQDRVGERLRTIDPAEGLSLDNLHGLGEARLFAEDLIADIHAAMANQLPWGEVDRGVLLAGPPGTGKTTLARAIAKDCGIKFINASAASWQSAGYLNDHIRAIRSDFTQARRFAPAILFIDEIDSIGNRERFAGDNASYNTEVVNALLEQIQGLDPGAPVFVIGATNHPDRVDPALRRAGRLDRTIDIPYPSSKALAAIYDYYLKPYADRNELASDIDTALLGQMSLRCTGADVELFVRGARRRARKAGRLLGQEDLLAEITGKPRDPRSMPVMTQEEIEYTAIHEAGHAVARCLSSSEGKDITFVSIVPRADGTLGFVAFAPSEQQSVTRAEYVEYLEIALAGRAAEEIRYGADGITSGAENDLYKATQMAISMISRYGLGAEGSLVWANTPTRYHMEQVDKLLAEAYSSIKSKLSGMQDELYSLAKVLQEQQELTGQEVLQIMPNKAIQ